MTTGYFSHLSTWPPGDFSKIETQSWLRWAVAFRDSQVGTLIGRDDSGRGWTFTDYWWGKL